MPISNLFLNHYGRLRSGWRFAVFLLFFAAGGVTLQAAAESAFRLFAPESPDRPVAMIVSGFTSLATAIFGGWLCGKYLEDLPFRALGVWFTQNWLKDLVLGVMAGGLAVSVAVAIAAAFGGLRFQFNTGDNHGAIAFSLFLSFAVFLVAAAFEEVLFRGYVMQTFTRAGLAWLAILLTSVFFGLVHLGNPAADRISTLNTIIAGILFSIAYLKTRTLWFVFGLHFFWNWTQGAVFGIEVSGLTEITTAPLLREIDRGPAWLTGENYGIEGGIACTISLLIFILLIWYLPILSSGNEMLDLTDKENPINPNKV